jgi:tRNA uridine 5-carboxymethylaminomethyl modification enzyme
LGAEGIVFPRTDSYIGILVDDLVTRGIDEPYRMFTSRSELRLLLRIDNADLRLTPLGHELGLVPEKAYQDFLRRYEDAAKMREFLRHTRWDPAQLELRGVDPVQAKGHTLEQLLRRPGMVLADFATLMRAHGIWLSKEARNSVEIEVRYEGYIEQQQREAEKMRRQARRQIPADFEYGSISGLSREVREKLTGRRPKDLATAARIPGMTPAAVSILHVQLELRQAKRREKL